MNLRDTIYIGGEIDDQETYDIIPEFLRAFYKEHNGFIAYKGGLHVRGCVLSPSWHSLGYVWHGSSKLADLFECVKPDDIPFAQDCFGDQYLIRENEIIRLLSETADLEFLEVDFNGFIKRAMENPADYLNIGNLDALNIQPGLLLSVVPPFCFKSESERSFKLTDAEERIRFLSDLSKQIKDLPDGTGIQMKIE